MSLLTPLEPGDSVPIPTEFPDPLANVPHPLAQLAARELQERLQALDPEPRQGQRFGVLVVETQGGQLAYLSAFHGRWRGQWIHDEFVPPYFDTDAFEAFAQSLEDDRSEQKLGKHQREERLAHQITCEALLEQAHQNRKQQRHRERERDDANAQRSEMLSRQSREDRLHRKQIRRWLEHAADDKSRHKSRNYVEAKLSIRNFRQESRLLDSFFVDRYRPSQAGASAAMKLLQYALEHSMKPLALAEFWWGPSPAAEVRHHRRFYPCARGSDGQLLPFVLAGVECEKPAAFNKDFAAEALRIVYEDDYLLVVDKPAGMLSVPGNDSTDSVLDRMRAYLPNASGPLLLHRLDLSTSGLLLVAKDADSHTTLQKQFIKRQVEKRYVAILEGEPEASGGIIDLPLRVDLEDRPRQVVCETWGKPAQTRWELVGKNTGHARVRFYPITGRTHQLRLHAAHRLGLGIPIMGDELYGQAGERLMLHAEQISITHPETRERMTFESPAPF